MEKLRTIRLYGKLGTKYGREHRLYVSSTSEAIRALCIQIPGFFEELRDSENHGIAYAILHGKRNIDKTQLDDPPGDGDIRIAPIIHGSKSGGLFQVILGAALIAVSFFVPASWGATFTLFGATANSTLFMLGASMFLGGVAQMLAPQPKLDVDPGEVSPNKSFSGPVNTTVNGTPVPIAIGEVIVGSSVISASIIADVPANNQRFEWDKEQFEEKTGLGLMTTEPSKRRLSTEQESEITWPPSWADQYSKHEKPESLG